MLRLLSSLSVGLSSDAPTVDHLEDPREWLEDVGGKAALDFVKEKNKDALSFLGNPVDDPIYRRILAILDSKEKIPYIGRVLNGLYYNFWCVHMFMRTAEHHRCVRVAHPSPTFAHTGKTRCTSAASGVAARSPSTRTVSYTHLTLPTSTTV